MEMEGLSVICAGLGFVEDDKSGNRIGYEKGEYCLDNLKDLLRFLRRDDPRTRQVFKQVCKWNIVSKDLIPIIEYCQNDRNLVLNSVKVLVFLTMPVEPSSNDIPQQIDYLWGLKLAITRSDIVAVILSLLENPLENLQNEAFTEDDWKLVQLVLTLFRNVLAIQDISTLQKAGGSATQFLSLRDRFLELLFHENVMDLVLVLAQHVGGSCGYLRQDNMLLLEIFHHIFMGQDTESIARAALRDSKAEEDATASLNTLKSIMQEEEEKRKLIRRRNLSRHSQFSGTFTRVTMDGSKALFKGNPSSASCDPLLRPQKVHRGPSKRMVWDHEILPSTRRNILELLHNFVNQFLSGGYNVLMQSIREDIEKEHPSIQNSDVVVFFRVSHFVISFQYHRFLISEPNMDNDSFEAFTDKYADNTLFKGDICGPIAASMNEAMFLLVISKWRNTFDALKELCDYKFLSATGSLLKTMIRMLDLVLKLSPSNSKEPQTARVLLYKLFYDQTDEGVTQFLFNLIKTFNCHKQSKSDLADLVEMIHLVIRLMENLNAHGTLRVSRKSRKAKQKKTLSNKNDIVDETNGNHATVDKEIDISACETPVDVNTSEKGDSSNACSAQKEDLTVDHFDGPQTSISEMGNLADNVPKMDKNSDFANDDFYCHPSDSSGDEEPAVTDEVDFKVSSLVSAIANNAIIQNLCWLLKFYKSNSASTNHYVLCMLRKICDDLELSPMLYQLSLLTTFYDILVEQKSNPCKDYENVVHFLSSLVRRMLRKMKNQPLLFVEILFWKTRKECHEINADSLLLELGTLKKETRNWASASHNGDCSTQDKGKARRSIADALGDDEVDVVVSHELCNQRDEGQYEEMIEEIMPINDDNHAEKLKESIINSGGGGRENTDNEGNTVKNEIQKVSKRRKKLVLNAELEEKVNGLYKKYQSDRHCIHLIAEALDLDDKVSPIQVSNMLKRLGLQTKPRGKLIDSQKHGNDKSLERDYSPLDSKDLLGPVRRASRTRKRVRAFSVHQEMMIKALFEKFKDHDRCHYMIANALDADGAISAVQVSQKLKQLGFVARQKDSEINMDPIAEDLNDCLPNSTKNSDDETLLSLMKRKSGSVKRKKDEKLAATLVEGPGVEDDSGNASILDFPERHESGQPSEMKSQKESDEAGLNDAYREDVSEAKVNTGISSGERSDTGLFSGEDRSPPQQSYDVLEDSGDDVSPVAWREVSARRKARMVIDLEDE